MSGGGYTRVGPSRSGNPDRSGPANFQAQEYDHLLVQSRWTLVCFRAEIRVLKLWRRPPPARKLRTLKEQEGCNQCEFQHPMQTASPRVMTKHVVKVWDASTGTNLLRSPELDPSPAWRSVRGKKRVAAEL